MTNFVNDVKLRKTDTLPIVIQNSTNSFNFRANSINSLEKSPEQDIVETKQEDKKNYQSLLN